MDYNKDNKTLDQILLDMLNSVDDDTIEAWIIEKERMENEDE